MSKTFPGWVPHGALRQWRFCIRLGNRPQNEETTMSESIQSAVSLAGRFLLSPIFLMSGVMKIFDWHETAQSMQAQGMSAVPFFLAAAIAFEILGGLSL